MRLIDLAWGGLVFAYRENHDAHSVHFFRSQEATIDVTRQFEQLHPPGSVEENLSRQIGYGATKPLTKLLDDYNWITVTKLWPNHMPTWLSFLHPTG